MDGVSTGRWLPTPRRQPRPESGVSPWTKTGLKRQKVRFYSEMLSSEMSAWRGPRGRWSGQSGDPDDPDTWRGGDNGEDTHLALAGGGAAAGGRGHRWRSAGVQARGFSEERAAAATAIRESVCTRERAGSSARGCADGRAHLSAVAGEGSVCFPHYLLVKTISTFILFSSGVMLCEVISSPFKQTNQPKGTEGKYHQQKPEEPQKGNQVGCRGRCQPGLPLRLRSTCCLEAPAGSRPRGATLRAAAAH